MKPELALSSHAGDVRSMFSRIARKYDKANRWMTWGQDRKWRWEVISRAHLLGASQLLDIGAGTGDLALDACRNSPGIQVVAADLTRAMMDAGKLRPGSQNVLWLNTDALHLPFAADTFDAVVSGYLLRNVAELDQALEEQHRVLCEGGRVVCLDTTPPPDDFWHMPVRWYLRYIIPVVGGLAAGNFEAYRYLPESTRRFVNASELARRMSIAGFKNVGYRCFMANSMAIHWGEK